MAKSVEERYQLALDVMRRVTEMSSDLTEIGCYTIAEQKYLEGVLLAAGLAAKILDPDKYAAWQKEEVERYKASQVSLGPADTLGQYL